MGIFQLVTLIVILMLSVMLVKKIITPSKILVIVVGFFGIIIFSIIVSQLMKPYQEKIDISVDAGVIEGLQIIDQSEDGRYLRLFVAADGEERRDIIYDIQNQVFVEEPNLFINEENLYTTKEKDNILEIFRGNELVYSIDLRANGFEKITLETPLNPISWSPTNKYFFVSQFVPDRMYNNLVIDMTSKTLVQMPVEGIVEIKWSSDDKKAILIYLTESVIEEYRWNSKSAFMDFENGDFKNIQFYGDWVPNSHYVFTETLERYDMSNGFRRDYFNVGENVYNDTIRWISPEAVVFMTSDDSFRITDLVPFVGLYARYFKPEKQFVNRLDFEKTKLIKKSIDNGLSRDLFWSSDYNDLYYTNNSYGSKKGFYRMKVNFGE